MKNNLVGKKNIFTLCLLALSVSSFSKDYLISTPKTSFLFSAEKGQKSKVQYYGTRIDDVKDVYNSGLNMNYESYPAFGLDCIKEKAIAVTHNDGNMSLDLFVNDVVTETIDGCEITKIIMKDSLYPVDVIQYFKNYNGTDVISTWVEIKNKGKKPVTLYQFASAYMSMPRGENWINHLHGDWASEHTMEEERLTNGQKCIVNRYALDNTTTSNPSFMLSMDGKLKEKTGLVMGGVLSWTGNYKIQFNAQNSYLNIIAGISEENSHYILDGKQTLVTPEFAMTYSTEGKGGVSRAFHKWARKYKLNRGGETRDILLNSWEGVYFKVNQETMEQMMSDFSDMGGELFVMDDGWFGNKYPRNNDRSSLGDWDVCKEKLPQGIQGLIDYAKSKNIKFGIWIEPEMTNTKSELFEKHPDWVLQVKGRELTKGRGGSQVVLDLTNPDVQDFVFGVVDNLMTNYQEIAYMKWDDNSSLMDYGSCYLPKNKQSNLYIDYQIGLEKVLKRIREKYPNLVMQACAGGGGRVNYGMLPYFDEFWTSDNTDALQRIYMQWGVSGYYPAIAMASHVSADRNHQTGRTTPLKFRFDVAMSGRLGMEIQPKNMSDKDKAFAKRAIAAYKDIREIVQFGDLYRLVSPYDDKGLASLMYVSENKTKAVFYAYKLEHLRNMNIPNVQMDGLDPNKKYRLKDLTPVNENKPCWLNERVISGKMLMEQGLPLKSLLGGEYSSLVVELSEVETN